MADHDHYAVMEEEEVMILNDLEQASDLSDHEGYDLLAPTGLRNFSRSNPSPSQRESKRWQDPETRLLLELYRQCVPQIGPNKKFKKKEAIWGYIKTELANKEHVFTEKQVKNKFTQLERSFKAVNDNNKQTGRKKRSCVFYKELQEILGGKSSVNPPFVLTASETTEYNALREDDDSPILSPVATSSVRSDSRSSVSTVSTASPSPSPSVETANNDSHSSPGDGNDSPRPVNVSTAPVTVADLKKSRTRSKKTLADELRAVKEVKQNYYQEKLKAYKDFNDKRLKLMAELLKGPSSSNVAGRSIDE